MSNSGSVAGLKVDIDQAAIQLAREVRNVNDSYQMASFCG